jgi:hypothetical protein
MGIPFEQRKQRVIDRFVSLYEQITPESDANAKMIRRMLTDITGEEEFTELMRRLLKPTDREGRLGRVFMPLVLPNFDERSKATAEYWMQLADKLDIKLFERFWITDPQTGVEYRTHHEHLCLYIPVRRQQQLQEHKQQIPPHTRSVDDLSGQVTGASKGSALTFPELTGQASKSLDHCIIEQTKLRGGDQKAQQAMERELMTTGQCAQAPLLNAGTRPKSIETLIQFMKGMHLDTNI